ncbi:hypothetical protein C5167_040563 [Papaver somniferum]|uniref:Uncharacterized protein n=1 Tax=Papaver somniferum TaxID=3469 RepID=A0A4Y7IIP1_PAPSO|nr:hypothetical protein C5167_040563 [Papaver somniferum]
MRSEVMPMGPVARRLFRFAEEIAREAKAPVFAIRIDCCDSQSIREAFEGVLSLGFVEVLVYNAYQQQQQVSFVSSSSSSSSSITNTMISSTQLCPTSCVDVRIDSFEKSLAVSTVGAFHCAQQVLPGMVDRRRGTILFTGCSASLKGLPGFSELCCGKFALRALSQCLAKEVQPLGVHVAHVIIDGIIDSPRSSSPSKSMVEEQTGVGETSLMDPDALAQTYWNLHLQDRNAWTHETHWTDGGCGAVSLGDGGGDAHVDSFEKSLAVSTVGAFHCAQQVLPGMVDRRRGTILFTGCSASLNGFPGFSELCCGKFALRALSQCLAKEVQPLGVHVAHVIIDDIIGPPRSSSPSRLMVEEQQGGVGTTSLMDPDALAQTFWYLHVQDRNAWTHEIHLRSSNSNDFNI